MKTCSPYLIALKSIRIRRGDGRLPLGVNAAHVYPLPAWNAADKARLKAVAEAEAVAEQGRRAPVGALAAVAAAPAAVAALLHRLWLRQLLPVGSRLQPRELKGWRREFMRGSLLRHPGL